jgi:hypothetical protein
MMMMMMALDAGWWPSHGGGMTITKTDSHHLEMICDLKLRSKKGVALSGGGVAQVKLKSSYIEKAVAITSYRYINLSKSVSRSLV